MLGPSGSGKTTCLRLIAGFEQPDSGTIRIFDEDCVGIPPYLRQVNTVFQDYALFPHMSVLDNVAYGLMIKGTTRAERYLKANRILEMVKLSGFGQRRPSQLSGGQRQRVALARALLNEPRVLLLDEPLGALDLKLREQMQGELRALQRELNITFVFVTHDQGEALAMADRVAIFNRGLIEQVGTPKAIYEYPNTAFAADFVGSANVLTPRMSHVLGLDNKWYSLRPEKVGVFTNTESAPDGYISIDGVITSVHYLGASTRLLVDTSIGIIAANIASISSNVENGQSIRLAWVPDVLHPMRGQS